MIEKLRAHGRLTPTIFLVSFSLYCFALTIFRAFLTGSHNFLFLNWNLYLAFIPWLLTSIAVLRELRNKIGIIAMMAMWLLFFPNSLYMLTDLLHLRSAHDAPMWFDLIIIIAFAWAGLGYGFVSLMDIEGFLRTRFKAGEKLITLLSICMIFVAAFGVYLGRFLRWNSWDIFGSPGALLNDVIDPFTDPAGNMRFWAFTFFMGTLLNFLYFSFKLLGGRTAAAREKSE